MDLGPADIDAQWEATFIVADPPRASWFALWSPDRPGGVLTAGLKQADVDLVLRNPADAGTGVHTVTAARLPIRDAIDLFATLPTSTEMRPSVRAWALVVRAGLDLIGRGRLLPWVSPAGWDTWRVDPLEGHDLAHVDALVAAMPAYGHCRPVGDAVDDEVRIADPTHAVRDCFDAVADRLIRAPASALLSSSPLFADLQPTKVPHLRPWVADVAGPLCRSALLSLEVVPPEESAVERAGFDAPSAGPDGEASSWRLRLHLRSARDPSLLVAADRLWHAPASVMAMLGEGAEIDLLSGLQEASGICPVFEQALKVAHPSHVVLDDDGFERFLDAMESLQDAGIDVRWPAELVTTEVTRRLVVGTSAPGDSLPSVNDIKGLLTVDWEFLVAGTPLTVEELAVLAEAKRSVVPLRGRWVRLSAKARRQLTEPVPEIPVTDVLGAALSGRLDGSALFGEPTLTSSEDPVPVRLVGAVAGLVRRLREVVEGREEPEPAGLEAVLRPYQRRGLAWLVDLAALGLGGCLADDMGLGKTLQLLALHQSRPGRTLVVCPTSLLANWEREARRFLPGATVTRFHGQSRSLDALGPDDLVVTTYGVVRSEAEQLAAVGWDLFVIDEAQHAKNPRSRTAKALRQIPATSRVALTGTPVENRLTELWSIMDWAVPGLLGPMETFRRQVAVPIERDDNAEVADRLATVIRPFLLRRTKADPEIAPELPPKTERDVVVPLTAEQVSLYQATTKEALFDLAQNSGLVRHGLILRLLTGLKQITNHPAQYLGETQPLAGRSGKLDALDHLLDRAHESNESALVFTQYVAMGKLLVDHLGSRGVNVEMLHGGQSISARQELVDRFQTGELPVLVLSLKAGGTGLNLTKATQVIHFDRWWNPAVEDQATDRAYRIGQDRPVTVHRLITEGTVEDRVAELLRQKRRLADRVVGSAVSGPGSGEGWISALDDQQLAELVLLESEQPSPAGSVR